MKARGGCFALSIAVFAVLLVAGRPASAVSSSAQDPRLVTAGFIDRLRFAQDNAPAASPALQNVIVPLEKSLGGMGGQSASLDRCHILPQPAGLTAYTESREAIVQIELLLQQPASSYPLFIRGILEEGRAALLEIYRFLADVAIQEAKARGRSPAAGSQVTDAQKNFDRALQELAAGQRAKAMQSLRQAWQHAQLALPPPGSQNGADPILSLQTPLDGAVLFSSPIQAAGRVHDVTAGPVSRVDVRVAVNGVGANVMNRSFQASGIALRPGLNAILAVATDSDGNVSTACRAVELDTRPQARISEVAGNLQTARIRTLLPTPLSVKVTDGQGRPVPGAQVVFRVVLGDGNLGEGRRAIAAVTDVQGLAAARLTVGSRAGPGVDLVRATAVGHAGEVIFSARTLPDEPAQINFVMGDNQFGGVGQALPLPLVVLVTDSGENPRTGVPVTFVVLEGGGTLGGSGSAMQTVETDSNGRAAVTLTLGPREGLDNNLVIAHFPELENEPYIFKASGAILGDPADTRISGVVLDNQGDPVPGVTMHLHGGGGSTVRTDAEGQFVLADVPVGKVFLVADASTATRPGSWASLEFEMHTLPGVNNILPKPIYILPLDLEHGKIAGGPEDVTITIPEVPGFSLTVLANSATFPGGAKTGLVSVTPVHADTIPMAPGLGMQPRFLVTIQPAGAHFDPPAPVTFPNVDSLPPGTVTEMSSFDHDLGEFVSIGTGTVSEDGTVVRSDPGVGITKAGWHWGAPQAENGAAATLGVEIVETPGQRSQIDRSLKITAGEPLILMVGSPDAVTATGTPPRDTSYSWQVENPEIASLNPAGKGLCKGLPTCGTTITAAKAGRTRVRVTLTSEVTGEDASDTRETIAAEFKLSSVTFSGDHLSTVYEDGKDTRYDPPHWVDKNLDGDAQGPEDRRLPISYVRTIPASPPQTPNAIPSRIKVSAIFKVEPSGALNGQVVTVKALSTDPAGYASREIQVEIKGDQIEISNTELEKDLPATVEFFKAFKINWEISLKGRKFPALTSDHRIYVTLGKPATSILYETLLDIGCRNAKGTGNPADGSSGEDEVVKAIWVDFQKVAVWQPEDGAPPGVRRKAMDGYNRSDGVAMKYYLGAGNPSKECREMSNMLRPDLGNTEDGVGTCGAWAELFKEILRAQGIQQPEVVSIVSKYRSPISFDPNRPEGNYAQILIKNWDPERGKVQEALQNGTIEYMNCEAGYTHFGREVFPRDGVPGQGNVDPPIGFTDHAVVRYKGLYYDPSYGTGPFPTKIAWENTSVFGYKVKCKIKEAGGAILDIDQYRLNDTDKEEVDFTSETGEPL